MGLRPAKCYRNLERPNTRQSRRKPRKSYNKGVPDPKIRVFEMGTLKEYSKTFRLVSKNLIQIRHNALEAARIAVNKYLVDSIGTENYFFKVLVFPHHIIRENPAATGAGADRYQTGMRLSFGKPIGTAARVKAGQKILEIRTEPNWTNQAKKALKLASAKFPTPCQIVEV